MQHLCQLQKIQFCQLIEHCMIGWWIFAVANKNCEVLHQRLPCTNTEFRRNSYSSVNEFVQKSSSNKKICNYEGIGLLISFTLTRFFIILLRHLTPKVTSLRLNKRRKNVDMKLHEINRIQRHGHYCLLFLTIYSQFYLSKNQPTDKKTCHLKSPKSNSQWTNDCRHIHVHYLQF